MRRRSLFTTATIIATAGLALTACSPNTDSPSSSPISKANEKVTVTFRLWDETAAPSYEESFAEFEKHNPNIDVKVDVVPWASYWDQLPLDISSQQMADVYWVNSSNFALYADNGNLMDVTKEIGSDHAQWQQSVIDLYTRDGKLWGVPQLWDSIALFYNKDLAQSADIDPEKLTWVPGAAEEDTALAAFQRVTRDANGATADSPDFDPNHVSTYAFNAQADLQAIYLDFLGSNGAQFQAEDDSFTFASAKGVESFQYLIDLINKYHVAPPASVTNINGDATRDMFINGELAFYQSGPYNLKTIADNASFDWGLAPMIEGSAGRVGVVHGVVAVGNEQTKHREETIKVLQWLGTPEGQMPLAKNGVSFPGVVEAQEAFVNYWAEQGVDVSVFIQAAAGQTMPAPRGAQVNAGSNALTPPLLDIFLGAVPVEEGLKAAQEAGNAAMTD